MAGDTTSGGDSGSIPSGSGKDESINFDDPLYIHPSDNAITSIVTTKLTGNENFRLWKSSISRALKARNKLGFIDGTLKKTSVDESKKSKWDRANAVVCSWLLSSISDSIYQSQAYSEEFDGLTSLTECTCEAAIKLKDHSNLMKLMQEESIQRNGSLSSLQSSQSLSKSQPAAFNSRFNNRSGFNNTNKNKTQSVQCKNCGIKDHTIDKCYKLIGYPKDFKSRNESSNQNGFNKNVSANSSTITSGNALPSSTPDSSRDSEFHQLTKEQYFKFLQLIGDRQLNEETSASVNMVGTCLFQAFNSSVSPLKWIVDSGANQHMIASESLLHDTVDVSKLDLLVSHPNGTSAKIEKIGNMNLSNSLTLFDVFAVPDFNVNLLSVHKGLQSKEMVGNGRESEGLYYINSVPSVRSDNGIEFLNYKMRQLFESKGILHQTSCVHTPQQNGVVERKHRHILNVARSLMFQSGLPLKFWGEAILTAVFLINRTPTSVLNGSSPYELVYKTAPVFDKLRVFGCLCFATKLNNSDKFSERADKCIFLGYAFDKKGYKVLSLDTNLIFVSRDIKFYESVFPFKLKHSSLTNKSNVVLDDPFSYDESVGF
ncbi:uncharacterized protein LOC128133479 [Lactuca sativa]|uniref:uncharacterized protein LOC128133479 n=1 Tax=Lactuca sativa TaxID=4236 RepID=UPI0022AFA5CA|nr:uncharacterized protein LOC128133479 [Lactuca sativa]